MIPTKDLQASLLHCKCCSIFWLHISWSLHSFYLLLSITDKWTPDHAAVSYMGANQCNVDVGFGVPVWCFHVSLMISFHASLMISAPSPTTCHLTSHNTDKKNTVSSPEQSYSWSSEHGNKFPDEVAAKTCWALMFFFNPILISTHQRRTFASLASKFQHILIYILSLY